MSTAQRHLPARSAKDSLFRQIAKKLFYSYTAVQLSKNKPKDEKTPRELSAFGCLLLQLFVVEEDPYACCNQNTRIRYSSSSSSFQQPTNGAITMRYSIALFVALTAGWATEHEAFRPFESFKFRKGHNHNNKNRKESPPSSFLVQPTTTATVTTTTTFLGTNGRTTSSSTRRFAVDPNASDQKSSQSDLDSIASFFARPIESVAPHLKSLEEVEDEIEEESVTMVTNGALSDDASSSSDVVVTAVNGGSSTPSEEEEEKEDDVDVVLAAVQEPQDEEEEPMKPLISPEQQEEFRQFVKEVLVRKWESFIINIIIIIIVDWK